tara:strand:+ start:2999 stop:3235 length:237 start_codon:yes stop_codon:yes gene_type:complete
MIKKEWHFMQTPKEKAYNIFKKFYNVEGQDFHNTLTSKIGKQCARLHINLILEHEIIKPHNKITLEYYQEVLSEIENL